MWKKSSFFVHALLLAAFLASWKGSQPVWRCAWTKTDV